MAGGFLAIGYGSAASAIEPPVSPVAGDILVTAPRGVGSAITTAEPVAVLDPTAIAALGVTRAGELLDRIAGLAASAGGAAAVTLLNGRRVSGPGDFGDLPPEAIEKIEVLPEGEAVRLGYPATLRVVNFITKQNFRAVSVFDTGGGTTDGGGETNYVALNRTRIVGPRRLTLSLSHLHEGAVGQDQRHIAADPAVPYALNGNIARGDGQDLSSRLDALAGRPVAIVALPADPAGRGDLAAYAAGARYPADLGASRTLQDRKETLFANGTLGAPLSRRVDASLNLSAEWQRTYGRNGYAPVTLTPPAGLLPFADGASLYRYIAGAVLRQRSRTLTLHAGGTVQGSIRRVGWTLVTSYDQVDGRTAADTGIRLDRLQAGVDATGDPSFVPLDPAADLLRLVSRTTTRTFAQTATANAPVLRLPAGPAVVTATLDFHRTVSSVEGGVPLPDVSRTIRGASLAAELPMTRPGQVPVLGETSLSGTFGLTGVSRYGRLLSYSYGLRWRPFRPVQITASITRTETAPAVELLVSPLSFSPNTPVFDFTTGTSVSVTALRGGNPDLAPSARRVTTLGAALQPWPKREVRLGVDYLETRLDGQTASLSSATPEFQAAYPRLFGRDGSGRLTSIDLRPVNLDTERERRLRLTLSLGLPLGKAPTVPAPAPGAPAQAPPPPKPRPQLATTITANYRFTDRLRTAPGLPSLDLLDGATLDGASGRPRWDLQGDITLSYGAYTLGLLGRLRGGSTIASPLPAADLRFSGRTWLTFYGTIRLEPLVHRRWARGVTVYLVAENALNDRVSVRDRLGATPDRFQAAYLDPLGRSLRVGVRKLF